MPTDAELLEAWRSGSSAAGKALVDRHFGSVLRFFSNKVSADPDDLVQATFLRCVEKRDVFEGHSSFRTFLFAVARNVLYEHFRRMRRAEVAFDTTSVAELDPSPSQVVAEAQWQREVFEALRSIPADMQLLFELYYWEGLSTRDIADVLGIARGTVKSRLFTARDTLRHECSRRGLGIGGTGREAIPGWARALDGFF